MFYSLCYRKLWEICYIWKWSHITNTADFLKEIALIQTQCSSQFHCSLTAFLTSTLLQCLVYCSVPFRIFWFSEEMVQGEGSFSTIKESYCKSWLSPVIFQIPIFCCFSYYEKIILQIITEINTLYNVSTSALLMPVNGIHAL